MTSGEASYSSVFTADSHKITEIVQIFYGDKSAGRFVTKKVFVGIKQSRKLEGTKHENRSVKAKPVNHYYM